MTSMYRIWMLASLHKSFSDKCYMFLYLSPIWENIAIQWTDPGGIEDPTGTSKLYVGLKCHIKNKLSFN